MLEAVRAAQAGDALLMSVKGEQMEAKELEHDAIESCVVACGNCSRVCLGHVRHCLELGGDHGEPAHIAGLLTCANICRTAAELMTIDSEWHPSVCDLCAQVCEECADACAAMDDMEECVAACRQCAQACRIMVGEMASEQRHSAETEDRGSTEAIS
jgi:hypothetical protein